MWKLNKPSLQEAKDDIELAFPKKKNKKGEESCLLSVKEKNELAALYDKYDSQKGRLTLKQVERVCSSKASDIKKKYNSIQKGKGLFSIRKELFKGIVHCPYCGISEPAQLDHFLPESLYPVLAINRQNLVPLCPHCNNIKRAKDYSKFIHAYYDDFPNEVFFIIQTTIVGNHLHLEYELDKSAFVGYEDTLSRIESQWEELELPVEWNRAVNVFLFSFFPESIYNGTEDGLRIYLQNRYEEYVRSHGLNDWRTALLRSLKDNPNFTIGVIKNMIKRFSSINRSNEMLV